MNGSTLAVTVLAIAGFAALGVVTVRYVRLRREVGAVVERLGSTDRGQPGSLERVVLHLERRLDESQRQEGRLRAAVEAAELGVVVADRKRRIVFTNSAAERVMAGREGDAIARSRVQQLIDRVTASGVEEVLEFDLHTPTRRVVRLRAVPLGEADGRGHAAVVYLLDLTDRRRVEAMRRDFVANAGHELRTPVGALSVLAEALADADDPGARHRLADRLRAEAGRMAQVVDDILELAALESLETPHGRVAVADVLADAESAVSVRAEEAGVTIVGKVPPQEVAVSGDHGQLVSAVVNLLDNAVKYTIAGHPEGGTVWYRGWADGGWVSIDVEDHGIGIAQQHRERIFERFYRVDRARSRESGGSGLGLSIVRNIAKVHGGEVTVRSEPGSGSTFTLKLPLASG